MIFLLIVSLIVSLPGAFNSEAIYPDGQRYLFNGLLIHDLVRDGAFGDVFSYAQSYYSHYPAFNLPYGPPFFAAQLALLFSVLGISFSTARLLIVAYTVLTAVTSLKLFRSANRTWHVSLAAGLLLISNPLAIRLSRDIATEMPIIFFSVATLYTAYQYLVQRKNGYGLASAMLLGLGYLTKQHIVPLGFGLALYVLWTKDLRIVKKRETLWAFLLLAILTVPYTVLSMKFSSNDLGVKLFPPISLELLFGYIKSAIEYIPLETILAAFGFVLGFRNQDRLACICFCWLLSWWVFFTFIYGYYIGVPRYILIILPALVYPAALTLHFLFSQMKEVGRYLMLCLVCLYATWNILHTPVNSLWGYSDAGRYVGNLAQRGSVLYAGRYDGNFLFGIRQACPTNSPFFLRSDQWLATRLWWGELKNEESVRTPDQIVELMSSFDVEYVAFETGTPEYATYQEYLNLQTALKTNAGFKRVAIFPIYQESEKNIPSKLEIYKTPFPSTDTTSLKSLPIKPSANL